MAATAPATANEERPDLGGHSPKLTHRELAEYEAGLESWVRTIRRAAPGTKEVVIRNAALECAIYIQKGFSRQIVVDHLNSEAASVDLNAEDLIDDHTTRATTSAIISAVPVAAEYRPRTPKPHDQTRLKPILWSDLDKLPKREALVEGLLDCAALSVMFGPSGCGKTFFALDLAAHVALGRPWRGRAVLQGAVVYVAPEGGHGILERLSAYSCQYGTDPKGVPLYVVPEPIDLCHSDDDANLLSVRLRDLPEDQPVRLIVIDTVSRALAGGNENSADHMGALVMRCDKLRASTGAHVMLLHHTGKDVSQGARGHSSLRAAVDTEIEMTWDKERQSGLATVTKQRDSRTEGAFAFKLADFDVDVRADGSPITSCAVMPADGPVATATKPARMSKAARTALGALQKAVDELGAIHNLRLDSPSTRSRYAADRRARRYKPSTTLLSLACTSFATSARPGLPIACMEATGSTAETSTPPSACCCTMTLQGSIVPILSSSCKARCASCGLHAPRIL